MLFECKHCKEIIDAGENRSGRNIVCSNCEKPLIVPNSPLDPHAILGDYIIEERLGSGGSGTIYLARQRALHRQVALKVLNEKSSESPYEVSLFMKEARAAARMNHPGFVQAYTINDDEGYYHYSMEYVEGVTLKTALARQGHLNPNTVLKIGLDCAQALGWAWQELKMVHCDIKPDNIMLSVDGKVKITDLGLAIFPGEKVNGDEQGIMGTAQYISPEHLMHRHADQRSDIYSLGATLYHAMCGTYPYTGINQNDIARKHLTDELIPPQERHADIPDVISLLIQNMLAKRPEDRYQNHDELSKDILLILDGKPPLKPFNPDAQKPILLSNNDECNMVLKERNDGEDESLLEVDAPLLDPEKEKEFSQAKNNSKSKKNGQKRRSKKELTNPVNAVSAAAMGVNANSANDKKIALSLIVAIVLVTMLIAGGGLWILFLRVPQVMANGDGLSKSNPRLAYRQIVKYSQDNPVAYAETTGLVKMFEEQFPPNRNLIYHLRNATADAQEQELDQLRKYQMELQMLNWTDRSEQLKEEMKQIKLVKEQQRREAEKRRLLAIKAEKDRQAMAIYNAKVKKNIYALRQKCWGYCQKNDYKSAIQQAQRYSKSTMEELKKWAIEESKLLISANNYLKYFYDSGAKLKDAELPVNRNIRNGRLNPKIESLDKYGVITYFHEMKRNNSGQYKNTKTEKYFVSYEDLSLEQLDSLLKSCKITDKSIVSQLPLNKLCYLFTQARYLEKLNIGAIVRYKGIDKNFMYEELRLATIQAKKKHWSILKVRLKNLVADGDKDKVKKIIDYMQRYYPNLYNRDKAEISNIQKKSIL